jgi:hypothetical protein
MNGNHGKTIFGLWSKMEVIRPGQDPIRGEEFEDKACFTPRRQPLDPDAAPLEGEGVDAG